MNDVLELVEIPQVEPSVKPFKTLTSQEEFLSLVMQEIENIKLHATNEEKWRLQMLFFNPVSSEFCIYGLMTGYCRNPRAVELINKCSPKIIGLIDAGKDPGDWEAGDLSNFEKISELPISSVGKPYKASDHIDDEPVLVLSMLEAYILTDNANNDEIMEYIKGERDTLILNPTL